jgi:hypothetical protein
LQKDSKGIVDNGRYLCGSLFFGEAAMLMASAHRLGKSGAVIVIECTIVLIIGLKDCVMPFDSRE